MYEIKDDCCEEIIAIAKEIADMHDGVISVTSTFGQGSTFILSLPTGKTVFDGAYSDAKAGIISDKPLHRAAAYFLGLQECEAAKSLGYNDLTGLVEEYEIIPEPEVASRDKALAKLLSAFGDERFEELKEELLYVEDFEEDDGPVTGLESEIAKETTIGDNMMSPTTEQLYGSVENIAREAPVAPVVEVPYEQASIESAPAVPLQVQPVTNTDVASVFNNVPMGQVEMDPEAIAREEARLQAKEEARKLLTQPVVQISADQRKTVSQINRESREKRVIHPIDAQKRYNSKRSNSEVADKQAEKSVADKSDVAVKSSLKKILDESDTHK